MGTSIRFIIKHVQRNQYKLFILQILQCSYGDQGVHYVQEKARREKELYLEFNTFKMDRNTAIRYTWSATFLACYNICRTVNQCLIVLHGIK